jgi:GrpB-like predicted nucleotidyltransferase (UPF0157 family)
MGLRALSPRPFPSRHHDDVSESRHPSLDDRFDPAVRIVEYDPAWPGMAEPEIERIGAAVGEGAVRIDHVGSTAVPGLAGKPIVDLQLSVADVDAHSLYVEPLEGLGYLFAPDPASPDFHFFGLPAARPRTHHLHICAAGSEDERRHLVVRDYLRTHPDEVSAYAELKRRLVARAPGDRLAYIEGKEEYVAALELRALAWATAAGR